MTTTIEITNNTTKYNTIKKKYKISNNNKNY